uniref:Uncharacterized protein n=1 Tax=Hanusia phi TaxID=3032 RepID=A0A7S0H4N7_9CRYP|mmetsp:Transcript_10180/g.23229  ORF Transcript_10180/g.23229 Transcript_10180/m.23229 type:complete len:367 (+) Transcript_10180:189-1289(+)
MARTSDTSVGSPLVVRQLSPRKHHDSSVEQKQRSNQRALSDSPRASNSITSGVDFSLIRTILHHNRNIKKGRIRPVRKDGASKTLPTKDKISSPKTKFVSESEHHEADDLIDKKSAPGIRTQDDIVSPQPTRHVSTAFHPVLTSPKPSVSSSTTPEFLDSSLLLDDFLTIMPGDYWTSRNMPSYPRGSAKRPETSPGKGTLKSPSGTDDRFQRQSNRDSRHQPEKNHPGLTNYCMYSTGNPKLFLETSPSRQERRADKTDHFLRQINYSASNRQAETSLMQSNDRFEVHSQALRANEKYRHSRSPELKDSSRRPASSLSVGSRVRDDAMTEENSSLDRKMNKLNVLIPQVLSSPDYEDEGPFSPHL